MSQRLKVTEQGVFPMLRQTNNQVFVFPRGKDIQFNVLEQFSLKRPMGLFQFSKVTDENDRFFFIGEKILGDCVVACGFISEIEYLAWSVLRPGTAV